MNEESGLSKYLTDAILAVLDQIANGNGPKIMAYIFFGVIGVFWIYCGLKIYFDARERFTTNTSMKYLFLLFGLITGPLGLIIYQWTKPKFTPDELDFIRIEHKFYYHQASKVLDCLKCDAYVLEGHSFCTNCGTQNRFKCENCGALGDYDDKYCKECGSHLPYRMAEFRKQQETRVEEMAHKESYSIQNLVATTRPKAEQFVKSITESTRNIVEKVNTRLPIGKKKASEEAVPVVTAEEKKD
jgi:RNA polymerase subunit RPABC4/transcription elongation factor Spt4